MKQFSKKCLLGISAVILAVSAFIAVKNIPVSIQKTGASHVVIDSLVHDLVCASNTLVGKKFEMRDDQRDHYRRFRKGDRAEDFCMFAPRKAMTGENTGAKHRIGRQRNDPYGQPACGDFQP